MKEISPDAAPDGFSQTLHARSRSGLVRYAIAVAAVVLGWAARAAITPVVGSSELPFLFFFPAVALAAWYGGLGPGILAIVLSAAVANWAFVVPIHAFKYKTAFDAVAMLGFVLSTSIIAGAIHLMHRSRSRLAYAHDLLKTTVTSIGDAVIATDQGGRITFLNPEAERLTEWTHDEAMGKPLADIFQIVNEHTRLPVENPVEKVFRTGHVAGLANHTVLIGKNGRETAIDDSAAPIRDPDAPLQGVVLVFRDVTLQREAQATQARLAAIVEHSGDVMVTKDLNGIIQSWNASAERLFGYKPEEIIGKHVTRLFPPERLHEEDHILGQLRAGKPVERLETVRVAKDGRRIPVLVSVSPLKSAEGQLVGASKVLHDITDLVAAREELQREKELLATTLASIGDGVIVTDAQGRITFLNGEAERLTKWKMTEAVGQTLPVVFRIIHEETREPVENPVENVLRTGTVVGLANHTLLIAKDGAETPIDDSAAPIRVGDGPLFGVVLVFRDFTEQKRAREAKEARNKELESVINQTPFMLVRCGEDLRYRFVSRAYAQMVKREPEEIIGKSMLEIVGEPAMKAARPHIEQVLKGNRAEFEIDVDYDGTSERSLHVVYTPHREADGSTTGWIASILDVTDRQRAIKALQEAHSQLADRALHLENVVQQRTARLRETIGELEAFSYSIAHDMRAPLRAMQGFSRILTTDYASRIDEKGKRYLERIEKAANRMDRFILDILNYSKVAKGVMDLRPVDAEALIREIIESYPTLQPDKADIHVESPLPRVLANEAALTQVISNLLGNAVKFVSPGVRPSVRVRGEEIDGFAQLWFEDNGIGIPAEMQSRLFDIFVRLHPPGHYEGTGIGLAIVRKAVERMGGMVGFESEERKGSRFWVRLQLTTREEE